ncbi:MAG: TetR/AcrR family transcriptional regulator C-terminal domain-containing protein, partial [Actinoallomurus sp.]
FAVMANAGLSEEQAVTAMTALTGYTIGFTMFAIARDQTNPEVADRRRERLRGIDPRAFPHLERVRDHILDVSFDDQFTDGLVRLVNSLIPET